MIRSETLIQILIITIYVVNNNANDDLKLLTNDKDDSGNILYDEFFGSVSYRGRRLLQSTDVTPSVFDTDASGLESATREYIHL